MKKVLLSAYIGHQNLGDEAIFTTLANFLKKQTVQLTVVTNDKTETRKKIRCELVESRLSSIARAIKNTDLLLMGGGGIIQDESSALNAFKFLPQIFIAKYYKKPVIWCFVGVGPIKHWPMKWMLRRAVKHITFAIVRDEGSATILREYGMVNNIMIASDPAIDYPMSKKLAKTVNTKAFPYIVIAPRQWFFARTLLPVKVSLKLQKIKVFRKRYDAFLSVLCGSLDNLLAQNGNLRIIAVPFSANQDITAIKEIKQRLNHSKRLIRFKTNMSEEEYLAIARDAKFLIGMRLHSLVLATRVNAPFIAISYSLKTKEFVRSLDAERLRIDAATIRPGQIETMAENIMGHRRKYVEVQRSAALLLSAKNQKAYEKLGKLINAV